MKHEKICNWLGLPAGAWPPDHYTLLGLKPGEHDVARIEQHAHERLAKLRCYQLSHPEQATEAMNRLAQAFLCLTDPEAKKRYDHSCPGQTHASGSTAKLIEANGLSRPERGANGSIAAPPAPEKKPPVPAPATAPVTADDTAVMPRTQVDWRNSPPPVRLASEGAEGAKTEVIAPAVANPDTAETVATNTEEMAASAAVSAPEAAPAQLEPTPESAPQPPPETLRIPVKARSGLGTLHAVIERIDQTRQLLWAWEQARCYFNKPERRLSRLAEQNDLNRRLERMGELMEDFPPLLGQPGQPGYRVVAMARLEITAAMFNTLDPFQREALARDWNDGRDLLLIYRRYLHREFKKVRGSNVFARCSRAYTAALNDHPFWTLVGLLIVGLVGAILYTIL